LVRKTKQNFREWHGFAALAQPDSGYTQRPSAQYLV